MTFNITNKPMAVDEVKVLQSKLNKNGALLTLGSSAFQLICYVLVLCVTFKFALPQAVEFSWSGFWGLKLAEQSTLAIMAMWLFVAFFGNLDGEKSEMTEHERKMDFLMSGILYGYPLFSVYLIVIHKSSINPFLFFSMYLSIVYFTMKLWSAVHEVNRVRRLYSYASIESINEVADYINVEANRLFFIDVGQLGRVLMVGELEAMRKLWESHAGTTTQSNQIHSA